MADVERETFYVGTFGGSFYTIGLDPESGTLYRLNETAASRCPDVFATDRGKAVLYVGNENGDGRGGVSAFDISDPVRPRMISHIEPETNGPCHIALIGGDTSTYLVGSGYFDGRLQAFALNEDGSIERLCCDLPLYGSGPYRNPNYISKQDQARLHCVVPIPGTAYFACADLGGDLIYVYRMVGDQICEVSRKKLRAGSGPRHIACASSGETWYLVDELDSCVSVLDFAPDTAQIEVRQRISALPDAFTNDSWCSAIHLSPDERFLYVGNRGHESIAIFRVEDQGKRLTGAGWYSQDISAPREFSFDVSGGYLLIGGMETGCVTLNRIDRTSGMLSYVSKLPGIFRPTCITSGAIHRDLDSVTRSLGDKERMGNK